jgi:tetraacyldisaccharide-1-P 4'-kinase
MKIERSDYLITTEKDLVRFDDTLFEKNKVIGVSRRGRVINLKKFKNKLREFVDFKM